MKPWATPPDEPARSNAEPGQVARAVKASVPVYLMATAGAIIVGVAYWNTAARPSLAWWLAIFCALSMARVATAAAFLWQPPPPDALSRWMRSGIAMALAQAALWGALAIVVLRAPGTPEQEAVLHVVLCATAMGAAVHLSPVPRILAAYVLCVLVPLAVRDVALGDPFHLVMASLCVLIGVYTLIIGSNHARALAELLEQRQQNASLVAALKTENARSERARVKAEEASAARTRFFAAANHDLRQPLNAIGLLAQSLQHVRQVEDVGEVAEHLTSCVDGMTDVVDELLEITRLDAGALKPDLSVVRLDQLARECCRQFEIAARIKGLAIDVDVPECCVRSDREMLFRIFGNLVSNAVRYTAAGRILVSGRCRGTVSITVEDTGIGIAPEHQSRVFDEFFQVGNPARDRRLGLGLGLATVKRLCDLLGHRVAVSSVAGEGSRFTVHLGDAVDAATAIATATATAPSPVAPLSVDRRVLVIEDDFDTRTAMQRLLASWGSDVRAVAALPPALDAVAAGFAPDALIVDLRLADGASGVDAVKALRQVLGPSLATLLVTGDANAGVVAEARQLGVPVMFKPVRPARLRAFLAQAFAAPCKAGEATGAGIHVLHAAAPAAADVAEPPKSG
jgi:signal transduction histidine kinase/CheY-like chemotaxis protein